MKLTVFIPLISNGGFDRVLNTLSTMYFIPFHRKQLMDLAHHEVEQINDVAFLEEYSIKIWIFMKLEMLMKVLKSFEKGSWCPQILEITLAPCFVYLLDFKSHILFVCPYFPGAHMKCQVWFFLNAAEIKLCLHWIQLEVAKGLSLLYCTFIWIPGHYFPQASVCVCVCVYRRT